MPDRPTHQPAFAMLPRKCRSSWGQTGMISPSDITSSNRVMRMKANAAFRAGPPGAGLTLDESGKLSTIRPCRAPTRRPLLNDATFNA